jgi:hypothetical protein
MDYPHFLEMRPLRMGRIYAHVALALLPEHAVEVFVDGYGRDLACFVNEEYEQDFRRLLRLLMYIQTN